MKNLTLEGSVLGTSRVGVFTGENSGIISNCKNRVKVTGYSHENRGRYISGIAGQNNSLITSCKNFGEVSIDTENKNWGQEISGIANNRRKGLIIGCENNGYVRGICAAGGISGDNNGVIKRCECLVCSILGIRYVSAIAGYSNFVYDRKKEDKDPESSSGCICFCKNFGIIGGIKGCGGIFGKNSAEFVKRCVNSDDIMADLDKDNTDDSVKCSGIGLIGGIIVRGSTMDADTD